VLGGRVDRSCGMSTDAPCSAGLTAELLRRVVKGNRNFYRAMHYSAKRGLAIACRLSVRPSVSLSVTLVDHDHIG